MWGGGGGGGWGGGVFKGTGSVYSRHTFIRAGHRMPQPSEPGMEG